MKDKTLLVTGGNEGIGLETAILFAKEGANVAIMGRREEKNEEARKSIESTGARCIAIKGDVSKAGDIERAVSEVVDIFGTLNFAFNNAGLVGNPEPVTSMSEEDFDYVIAVNLKGVWLSMKYELPAIVASGGGCIVNTGSITSSIGLPNVSPYVASKHGVVGLTRSAALEWVDQGVRVNAVCPGVTAETGMMEYFNRDNPEFVTALLARIPMGRYGRPSEFSGIVRFLCSEAAGYITGQTIYADGGYTVP